MSDKSMPERMGVAETKIDDLETRTNKLEQSNEDRKNWFLRQLWGLMKMLLGVTVLTFLTEMAKDGCRVCKSFVGYFTGGGS